MSLEGYVDKNEKLKAHPVCYGAERGNESKGCGTGWIVSMD